MTTLVRRFLQDTRAASSIEYAALASLVSVAIIATVLALGSKLKIVYTGVDNAMN